MSSAPAHDHASDHDAHAFDGEPVQALAADEPRTPGWLPAIGVALFATAAVAFLATRDAPGALPQPPAAPARVEPAPAPEATTRPGTAAPARSAGRQLTAEQTEMLKKRMDAVKARGQLPGAGTGAARRPGAPPAP